MDGGENTSGQLINDGYTRCIKRTYMKQKTRTIINISIVLMVFGAWLYMAFGSKGELSSNGIGSLKYYTVLSNIFEGLVCLVWLLRKAAGKEEGRRLALLRLCSTAGVLLTFTVVVAFLGPLYGYLNMYKRANFWFHLVVPVLSVAEFVMFNAADFTKKEKLCSALSVLDYGSYYLANILFHDTSFKYDIYGFVQWGLPVGIVIFAVISLVIYAEGLLMCAINRRVRTAGGK